MALQIQSDDGTLRIRIRPRVNRIIAVGVPLIVAADGLAMPSALRELLTGLHGGDLSSSNPNGLFIILAMGPFLAIGWCLSSFSSWTINLTTTTLEIQRRLFSLRLSRRVFDNRKIENLRYNVFSGLRWWGPRNAICFESSGENVAFARQCSKEDSEALIAKTSQIYGFSTPLDSPVGIE